MSRSQSAAVSRRRLRSLLRRLRTEKGFTQKDVADALEWSPTKLMRIEMGKVNISRLDLKGLLDHYGVGERERVDELLALARNSREGSSLASKYKDVLSKQFAEFVEHEEAARIIRHFEPQLIPGPLQTADYATAVLRTLPPEELSDEVVTGRVEARLERKALLLQEGGPEAFFLLDESALLRQIGAESTNGSVMTGQLQHLRELAAHPKITIQFLPFTIGSYRAMQFPFVILEFDDPTDDGLVYIEGFGAEPLYEESETIVSLTEQFQELESKATKPSAVNTMLDRALERIKEGASILH
jgi:transcriptional regulator with XRE-family HTH domain